MGFYVLSLIIGGVIQVIVFFILFNFSEKAKEWPTTRGQILSSEVCTLGWNDENSSKSYKPIIKYQYEVEGILYTSSRLHYGDWIAINSSFFAKKTISRYGEGCKCIVHYNPRKPQVSVLETKLGPPTYFLLGCGILFIIVGLALLQYKGIFVF